MTVRGNTPPAPSVLKRDTGMFIRKVEIFLPGYMASHPRRQYYSITTVLSMEDLRTAVLNLVSVNLNGEKITHLFSLISN